MPIYEYRCREDGHKFEMLRTMDRAGDPAECPECGSDGRRLLSLFASFSATDSGDSSELAGGGGCCGGSCGCGPSLN